MTLKKCSRCKQELPLTQFYKAAKGTYGVGGYCKACQLTRLREWNVRRKQAVPLPDQPTRRCSTCCQELPVTEFYRNVFGAGGLHSKCKACHRQLAKDWRANHPERVQATNKAWEAANRPRRKDRQLKRDFGMSLVEYEKLAAKQEGCCAICGERTERKHLDVDHDHKTGQIRGLLCNSCNQGLGYFKDDQRRLYAAIDYLKKQDVPNCEG